MVDILLSNKTVENHNRNKYRTFYFYGKVALMSMGQAGLSEW